MSERNESKTKLLEALQHLDLGSPMMLPCVDSQGTERVGTPWKYSREELLRWKGSEASAAIPSGLDEDLLASNWEREKEDVSSRGNAEYPSEEKISLRPGGTLGGETFYANWKSNTPGAIGGKKTDSKREFPTGLVLQTPESGKTLKWDFDTVLRDVHPTPSHTIKTEARPSESPPYDTFSSPACPKGPAARYNPTKGYVQPGDSKKKTANQTGHTDWDGQRRQGKGLASSKGPPAEGSIQRKGSTQGADEKGQDLKSISDEIERERLLHRQKHQMKSSLENADTARMKPSGAGTDVAKEPLVTSPRISVQSEISELHSFGAESTVFSEYEKFFATSSPMQPLGSDSQKGQHHSQMTWLDLDQDAGALDQGNVKAAGTHIGMYDSVLSALEDKTQPKRYNTLDAFLDMAGGSLPPVSHTQSRVKTLEEIEREMVLNAMQADKSAAQGSFEQNVSEDPTAALKNLLKIDGSGQMGARHAPGEYPPSRYGPPAPAAASSYGGHGYGVLQHHPADPRSGQFGGGGHVLTAAELEQRMQQ